MEKDKSNPEEFTLNRILYECPFVNYYVNEPESKKRTIFLKRKHRELKKEIERVLGDEKEFERIVDINLVWINNLKVFRPNMSEVDKTRTIAGLIICGYELGNKDDLELMSDHILDQLYDDNVIDESSSDPNTWDTIDRTVGSLLHVGSYIRDLSTASGIRRTPIPDAFYQDPVNVPDGIRSSLGDLDLRGI